MLRETPATLQDSPKRRHLAPTAGLPTRGAPSPGSQGWRRAFLFECGIMKLLINMAGPELNGLNPTLSGSEGSHLVFPKCPIHPWPSSAMPVAPSRRRRAGCIRSGCRLRRGTDLESSSRPLLQHPLPHPFRLRFLVWREKEVKPVLWGNLIASRMRSF